MRHSWNLDPIYPSFESDAFQNDLKKVEKQIEELNQLSQKLSMDTASKDIEEYLNELNDFYYTYSRLSSYAGLTFTVDTSNVNALKYEEKLEQLGTQLTKPAVLFQKFVGSLENLETVINSNETLKTFEFYLLNEKKSAKHLLSDKEEVLAAKLSMTGSSAWSRLQEKLFSTLTAPFEEDGEMKELPVTVIRNYAHAKEADTRKRAYESELASYDKISESSAAALNGIKGEVITMQEMRGYDSPLSMTLESMNMTEKTLDAMISAIKDALPSFHSYLKTKAKVLGHEKGLPFYDMFAPIGESSKTYSYDEASQFVVENFASFSKKLSDYAKHAIDSEWIDVEPKTGKVGGAFCAGIGEIKESRILLNFTGTLNDVTTLAHELGHGYHNECAKDEAILNTSSPMPLAETASTFCETIVNNAALGMVSENEAITILEGSLQDATQVTCDILSRFIFESKLFGHRSDSALSVDDFKNYMIEAQKEAYGDGLDSDLLHPYMWVCKPHYYSAGLNFYNFPYAFGLLFAKGLYAKYLEDKETFVGAYDTLLASTGKMSIVDVCKTMAIDVEDQAFWRSSLSILEKDITTFNELAEKLYL